ncbi:hypothetical protein B0H13DRAFT_2029721, partial [Mycena leptocephala]
RRCIHALRRARRPPARPGVKRESAAGPCQEGYDAVKFLPTTGTPPADKDKDGDISNIFGPPRRAPRSTDGDEGGIHMPDRRTTGQWQLARSSKSLCCASTRGAMWKQAAALSGRPYVHPPPPRENARRRSRVVLKTDPDLVGLEAAQARGAATIWCEMDLDSEHEEIVRQRERKQATWMW